MNKLKSLVCMIVIFCTMSTISYAKSVVRRSDTQDGTEEKPFILSLGDGIIDVYYADENAKEIDKESYKDFYFKFSKSNSKVKSANYMVEHNSDKHRVRFTLMGTSEADLQVASSSGLNYFQAGAKTIIQSKLNLEENSAENVLKDSVNDLKEEIQAPFYTINATETIKLDGEQIAKHKFSLANGFIRVDNVLGANVSTYSTSYVFAVSDEPFNDIYTITQEQITRKAKISLLGIGRFKFVSQNELQSMDDSIKYAINGADPIEILYCFNTTRSEIGNSEDEEPPFVEKVLSKIFLAFGDAMVSLTQIGKSNTSSSTGNKEISMFVTIDSLVFNEYPKTIVDLWGDVGSTNVYAKKVVRFWFNAFKAWAIAVYIILLVYVGIKAVISTGTPEQRKIRPMIEGWLTGLLMLFFLPFLFKYVIKVNDVLVDIVRTNSKYSVYAYYTFEDQYKNMGGKQDGEDSMTSIVDRLTNAKEDLLKQIENLDSYIDAFDEGYEEALKKLNEYKENKKEYEEAVKKNLNDLKELYTAGTDYQFRKDGVTMTVNQIYNELVVMAEDYFKDKSYFNEETKQFDSSIADGFESIVRDYAEKFMVCYPDGTEADKTIYGEPMNKWDDGKMWYTHFLQDGIKDIAYASVIDPTIVNIYEQEAWVKYYEAERDKYIEEQNKKQEQVYGIEKAIERAEDSDADLMGIMRARAGKTSKFIYVLVWLMLIFQVILLLILYYKRLFMIAILVSVFPLVTIAYAFEKTQGTKGTVFKNWIQEYLINVFIQAVHAILYVTIVELGYTVFLADGDNWLLFAIATWAMISAEPIFKNLIGLKGQATLKGLGDYAKSTDTLALGALSATAGVLRTGKDIATLDDRNRNKEAEKEKKNAKEDKKAATKRKEEENDIKKKYGEKSEEGKKLLEEKKKREEEEDKKKAEKRKKAIKRRRNFTRARMIMRGVNNLGQVGLAVSAALATGNEGTLSSADAAIGGLRKLDGSGLSDDAKAREKRIDEEQKKEAAAKKQTQDNVNEENRLKDVTTQIATDGGSGTSTTQYDNYGEGSYRGDPVTNGKYVENIAKYKAALETQKKHTDYKWQESENWSINEDDEE